MEFALCMCQATGDGERAFKNKGYYAIENEIRLQIAYERGQSKRYIVRQLLQRRWKSITKLT